MKKQNIIIAGARGRDLHNFIVYFKDNSLYHVVCFTAAQIPGIEHGTIPKQLLGKYYKKDIPVYLESELPQLIKKFKVDYVYLSYSDLSHQAVMEKASLVLAAGANFALLGTKDTYVVSKKPVIAVTAVRTGAGKSQTSRAIGKILKNHGKKVVAIRHGMPYSKDLTTQVCQRFSSYQDFITYKCTIEEEEEYQPWIDNGFVVYSGFDYKKILKEAEKEATVIVYDAGNNDLSMIKPDLNIVVVDPHRPGHEISYYPGFVNFLMADVILINKVNTAKESDVRIIEEHIKKYNPKALVIKAASVITVDNPELLKNNKVLVIGDGPSLTHGGLKHGAGYYILNKYHATIVDAEKYAVGSIKEVYQKYPHLKEELPAMGYSEKQIKELQETINRAECNVVLDASPANLSKILKVNKPMINVGYELDDTAVKELEDILKKLKFI